MRARRNIEDAITLLIVGVTLALVTYGISLSIGSLPEATARSVRDLILVLTFLAVALRLLEYGRN
ncbi:hypothetical protein E6H29_02050 [Candidatus Bathyarchaeota archaeon]|nr:MAG: hypothetical protein E6H29_02050 [Candidatus Bathyarchaeota archaeon]